MLKHFKTIYIYLILILTYSCKPEEELSIKTPVVITSSITSSTDTSAVGGGIVTSSGATKVTERGVCWAIYPQPTINDNKTIDGEGTGPFTSYITGLVKGTTYYVRAYATNKAGTAYGEDKSFYTTSVPIVTTLPVINITSYSAECGGTVISDGGSQVIVKGVCWSTTPNPTINNFCTANGSGLGSFVSVISNLKEDTVYYVRAYATNANGTGYGEEYSFKPVFTCGQNFKDIRDGKIYGTVQINNQCWMKQNLDYGIFVNSTTGQNAVGTQKYCQKNIASLCDTYGGMYLWEEIMNGEMPCNGISETQPQCSTPVKGICPDGWHIPSHYEWTVLEKHAGSAPNDFVFDETTSGWYGVDEGNNLKMNGTQYWGGEGTNLLGFDGLAGGYYLSVFAHMGDRGKWWSSTEFNINTAWHRGLKRGVTQIYREAVDKNYAFSLRCIKNN